MKTINYKYNKLQIHADKWGYLVFEVYKRTKLSSPWYKNSLIFKENMMTSEKFPDTLKQ